MSSMSKERRQRDDWKSCAAYTTTGEFSRLKKGYVNHCGPVAITNVILTCAKRQAEMHERQDDTLSRGVPTGEGAGENSLFLEKEKKNDIFLDVAKYGTRHLFYLNKNLFHHYGGTSDVLSGPYLRLMLRRHGIRNVSVSAPCPLTPRLVRRALDKGAILYVMLFHHKKYKAHHLICYSYEKSEDGAYRYLFADGWAARPIWLTDADLHFGAFRAVRMR